MNKCENNRWLSSSWTKRGEVHERRGLLCQARTIYKEKHSIQVIALTESRCSSDQSVLANEILLENVAEYFMKNAKLWRKNSRIDLKNKMQIMVENELEYLSLWYDLPRCDLGISVIAACVDHVKSRIHFFQYGKGCVTILTKNAEKIIVSNNAEIDLETFYRVKGVMLFSEGAMQIEKLKDEGKIEDLEKKRAEPSERSRASFWEDQAAIILIQGKETGNYGTKETKQFLEKYDAIYT